MRRRYLTTFLTFGDEPAFVRAASRVQSDLHDAPVVACKPSTLHQTMQGIAWEDEIVDLAPIRKRVAAVVKGVPRFFLTAGPPEAGAEGVWLLLAPLEPLVRLNVALHTAITEATGRPAPGRPSELFAHMSVAYCNAVGDASALERAARRSSALRAGPVLVDRVDLLWLRRTPAGYEWDLVERFPLSG